MIDVTRPFLPPREEYETYLKGIWERNWLTNNGPLVVELESKLKSYLDIGNVLFVGNGTVAIQLAIKALGLKGKIITTPFSYVATTSSIVWEGCEPVFVDIDPKTLNIDAQKIEQAITPDTSGILATHVYGNACDIEAIDHIARKHNLKVIYDAAHAFGTKYRGKSIFDYGDVSTASFHATKIFHTIEGGAVFARDPEVLRRMQLMRNFGHNGPGRFDGVGINGKNSEFHAAMGLCVLRYMDAILKKRKESFFYYNEALNGLGVERPLVTKDCDYNYSYYAVLFRAEEELLAAQKTLEEKSIFSRRYFYPALSSLHYVERQPTPTADAVTRRVLCLPLYDALKPSEQDLIVSTLLKSEILFHAKSLYPR